MPLLNEVITAEGPIINMVVATSEPRSRALRHAGLPIPEQLTIPAMLDTGASTTCISMVVVQALGLSPTGSALTHTPSTGLTPASVDMYDVAIAITNPEVRVISMTLPVLGIDLSQQPIEALIGRDVLSKCLLVYDGLRKTISLAM